MKFFNFIDGVEEDKDLRLFIDLFIKMFEDGSNDVFVHFCLILQDLEVILDSFKSNDLLSKLLLHQFIDVELDNIINMLLVEVQELFLHGS